MSAPTPCLRHSEHRWLAYCDDCRAWHLARQIAARQIAAREAAVHDIAAHDITPRGTAGPRLVVVPAVAHGPEPAVPAVA